MCVCCVCISFGPSAIKLYIWPSSRIAFEMRKTYYVPYCHRNVDIMLFYLPSSLDAMLRVFSIDASINGQSQCWWITNCIYWHVDCGMDEDRGENNNKIQNETHKKKNKNTSGVTWLRTKPARTCCCRYVMFTCIFRGALPLQSFWLRSSEGEIAIEMHTFQSKRLKWMIWTIERGRRSWAWWSVRGREKHHEAI